MSAVVLMLAPDGLTDCGSGGGEMWPPVHARLSRARPGLMPLPRFPGRLVRNLEPGTPTVEFVCLCSSACTYSVRCPRLGFGSPWPWGSPAPGWIAEPSQKELVRIDRVRTNANNIRVNWVLLLIWYPEPIAESNDLQPLIRPAE